MDRRHIEIDLPGPVAERFASDIDAWLEGNARPGDRLQLRSPAFARITTPVLAHPAVTATDIAEDTITLRLVDLQGVKTPMYLIEAADRPSKRAIEALAERLAPKKRPQPAPFAPFAGGMSATYVR